MQSISPELIQLIAGLALCLFGWVCYWGGIHLLGAIMGVALGAGLGWLAIRAGALADVGWLVLTVAAVIGALVGIFLIRQVHRGFFLIAGALVGLVAGLQIVLVVQGMGEGWPWLKPAGAALGIVAGALLFLLLSRHIIILITAFLGASLAATAYAVRDPLLIFLVVFFTAVIFQTGAVRWFGFRRWEEDR